MTSLYIIIWFTLTGFLLTLYLTFCTWYLWSALIRKSHCAWKALHLIRWYPRGWSSTICERHDQQPRAQSAARRARRFAEITSTPEKIQV